MQPSATTIERAISYFRAIISDNGQPCTRRQDSGDMTEPSLLKYNCNINHDSDMSYLVVEIIEANNKSGGGQATAGQRSRAEG